jgi:segregation and condensation protein A
MVLSVAVEQFEGPLGLLLQHVEAGRVEVTSISVAYITREYLDHLKQLEGLSSEEVAEFARLGARLVYIKSLALLPPTTSPDQAEELEQLNLELKEYAALKAAATALADRQNLTLWSHPAAPVVKAAPGLPVLPLEDLATAFQEALKRHTPNLPAAHHPAPHLTQQAVTRRLQARLAAGRVNLAELIDDCHSRLEIILTFMASLELLRAGQITMQQNRPFSPIVLEAARG